MKRKITKIVALFLIVSVLTTILSITSNAEGIYNTYKGTEYTTEDEINTLEETLKTDGYVLVDESYYDDLKEKDYFWYGYLGSTNVWISKDAWNGYLSSGSVSELKDNTIITSNYANENYDGNVLSDHYGDNLSEDEDWGTIIIKGNMDADILQASNHPQAFVTIYNKTLNEKYQLTLDYYNNYTTSVNCPSGQYVVYTAYIDEAYPAVVENEDVNVYGDGQYLSNLGSITFNITYGDTVTKEQYAEGTYHNEEVTEKETKSEIPFKTILIIICIVAVVLVVLLVIWLRKIYKNNKPE